MKAARSLCAAIAAHLVLGLGLFGILPYGAIAAVPVEESFAEPIGSPVGPRNDPALPSGATGQQSETRRLSELFYQLQVLQEELQQLRGMVEQQAHQIRRMERDQQDRYMDLDRRLTQGAASRAPARPSPSVPPAQVSAAPSERDAYSSAFDLMKARQYDASADAFNQLIVDYPNGEFTPNAFYWLGELYLARSELERARQSFAQVTNLFPDHLKVSDALYKLGVVYHRLGDNARALQYLNRVRQQYPESSAAGLAETYAAELQ